MGPPQANGRLTRIRGGGTSSDYRDDAGVGPTKWQGDVAIYYRERRRRTTGPEGENMITERELYLETRHLPATLHEGDDVEFTVEGSARTGELQEIIRSTYAPARPAGVETTRLILEPA